MPLIILFGFPMAGKTTKSKEIIEYYKKKHPKVEILLINEEKFEIDK